MILIEVRKKIIEIAVKIQKEKLVPLTFGNFSIRDQETGYVCITPSGMPYDTLTAEDIVVVDVHCNVIDGNRKPSIETPMHCAVYRKRQEVMSVVHTHSTFVTAWAACGKDLPVVVAEVAALVSGPVRCAPYMPCGTVDLAEVTSDWLGKDDAVLLGNHGALTVGPNIDTAYTNAVIIEEGAKIAYYAKNIGEMKELKVEECQNERTAAIIGYGQ